jgi:serine/threonine protein kinase
MGEGLLSFASDIYSYGMTVLEVSNTILSFEHMICSYPLQLFTHEQPYKEIKHKNDVVIRAYNGQQPLRPPTSDAVEPNIDDELWSLLQGCWAVEMSKRPTVQDILSSVSLTSGHHTAWDSLD